MADLQLWKKTNQLQLLISTWYRSSFDSKVQNASFLPKLITKNYTCSSSSFRQKIDLNSGRTTIAASLTPYFGIYFYVFPSLFSLDMLLKPV